MRENAVNSHNHLHWHNGSTCHGYPSLEKAIDSYKRLFEDIDIYEHTDKLDKNMYMDKDPVKCYVGIRPEYDKGHYKKVWKKKVKLVAKIRVGLTVTLL